MQHLAQPAAGRMFPPTGCMAPGPGYGQAPSYNMAGGPRPGGHMAPPGGMAPPRGLPAAASARGAMHPPGCHPPPNGVPGQPMVGHPNMGSVQSMMLPPQYPAMRGIQGIPGHRMPMQMGGVPPHGVPMRGVNATDRPMGGVNNSVACLPPHGGCRSDGHMTAAHNVGGRPQCGPPAMGGAGAHEQSLASGIRAELQASIRKLQEGIAADGAASSATPAGPAEAAPTGETAAREPLGGQAVGGAAGGSAARAAGGGTGSGVEGSTVYIANIPEELCVIDCMNEHFKRFGRIVNMHVRPNHRNAFIQFSSRAEAVAALDAPDPVLNTPAITVKWANSQKGGQPRGGPGAPPPNRGQASPRSSTDGPTHRGHALPLASKSWTKKDEGELAAASRKVASAEAASSQGPAAPMLRAAAPVTKAVSLQKAKRQGEQLIQAQLAQQKVLIAQLSSMKNASKADKAVLMSKLEKLSESVQSNLKSLRNATAPS